MKLDQQWQHVYTQFYEGSQLAINYQIFRQALEMT